LERYLQGGEGEEDYCTKNKKIRNREDTPWMIRDEPSLPLYRKGNMP
jgi:hypothetical protein